MVKSSLIPLLFATVLSASNISAEGSAIQKGSNASAALLQKLGGELTAQMQNGGPMAALNFCAQNALHLTDQVAKEHNLSIKRVSLQYRNPINAASSQEISIMEKWKAMQKNGESLPPYELISGSEGKYSYYKPITINKEACLKCHGNIGTDTPLAKAIKELYPEDKATGYVMGDLRGMIVITLPKER